MSVRGIELFRDAMRGHEDSYVLIGGSACDLLMGAQGERFRATMDLDVVALSQGDDAGFAAALWSFVREGGYEPWTSSDGTLCFYRFVKPKETGYPHMIELFARHPGFRLAAEKSVIAPLPFDEDVSSLSAILLDDDYYQFILEGLVEVEGISTLDAAHLIPLKMRAHIDLAAKHASGAHVNTVDLKKHRKDVFRLLALIPTDTRVTLPAKLAEDALSFIETVHEPGFRIDQLSLGIGLDEAIAMIEVTYGITKE